MRHVVYLIQRGLTSNQVVSGRTGKNYGTAVHVPARGGVVLKMTMEEYTAAKDDIVGNTAPNQQWVPDIVPEAEAAPGRGKCGIPSGCRLGVGGHPADAEFIWDRHLFCRGHAPNNASPIDDQVIPLSEAPPAPAPKDAPEPKPPVEQPVVMPPPAVADEEVRAEQPPAAEPLNRQLTHEGVQFEFVPGAVRVGKTKLSTTLLQTLGENEPNPDVWFRIVKREGDGLLLLESKKLDPKAEPKEIPPAGFVAGNEEPPKVEDGLDTMPWQQLQKLAKKRGMNILRQRREALVKWVREHPDNSGA
jgi:hypothetical protein